MNHKIKTIIKILVFVIIIFTLLFICNYYEHREAKQKIEEQRIAQQEADIAKKERKKEERLNQYVMAWNIGTEYFEKGLTTEEWEKRRKQLIAELPGKNYFVYARLNDIKKIGRHREIDFISALMSINLISRHKIDYRQGIRQIFYDDDLIITDVKINDRLDFSAQVKDVKIIDDTITIYLDIRSLEKKYVVNTDGPFDDERL